jgi:putative ABC transport system permease protein
MKNGPRWLFRLLIALFPRDHRRAFGDEMLDVFEHRFAGRRAGWAGGIAAAAHAVADGVGSALRVRFDRFWPGRVSAAFTPIPHTRAVFRQLLRAPGFSATVLLVLAGAVAVNAAVFAFLRGSLFDAPTWRDPAGVMLVWGSNPSQGQIRDVIAGPTYIDLSQRSTSLTTTAALHGDEVVLTRDGRPTVYGALEVSVDFLRLLGVEPALGRDFGEGERLSGGEPAVIVSHAFWREELGGDVDAPSTTLVIDGETRTIVGVLPAGFRFADPVAFLRPLHDDLLAADARTRYHYSVLARLAPNVTPADATREASAIMADIARQDARMSSWSLLVEPFLSVSVEAIQPVLWLLAAAVALVLLVAAVNLAALFRIRTLQRARELSVRAALGAGRARIFASLVAEALILSAAGGLLGVLLAAPLLDVLVALAPPSVLIPGSAVMLPTLRATLDFPVAAGSLVAAVLAGLLVAAPSLVMMTGDPGRSDRTLEGTRVRGGVRAGWLVGAQIALATVLCAVAGVTLRSAWTMVRTDLGVEPERVLTLYFGDVEARPVAERANYFRDVLARVADVPGVVRAGTNDYLPFQGEDDFQGVIFPERPPPLPGQGVREEWRRVSEGFFDAAGMRVVSGRGFLTSDFDATPAVVVLNEAFAAKHYPGVDPVGRRLGVTSPGYRDLEIVGVMADVLERGPAVPAAPMLFVPDQGGPRGTVALFVRTADDDPMTVAAAVQAAIWSVDSTQPVMEILPMTELTRRITAVDRLTGTLVGALASIALGLAAVGVFGVTSFTVASRRGELGVRLALGATARRLQLEVLRSALGRLAAALAVGIVLAVAAERAARSVLPPAGGSPSLSTTAAVVILAFVVLLAGWIPVRRVASIAPNEVIRRAEG